MERGEFARGASTITQQLARNLYLSPSKNLLRKVRELLIARRLEASLSKQRIFELYLNVIEWGDSVWGAEAASRRYFHKPASELSAAESALLAGAISSPRNFDPAHPIRPPQAAPADDHAAHGCCDAAAGRAGADLLPVEAPGSTAFHLCRRWRPDRLPGTPVPPDGGRAQARRSADSVHLDSTWRLSV